MDFVAHRTGKLHRKLFSLFGMVAFLRNESWFDMVLVPECHQSIFAIFKPRFKNLISICCSSSIINLTPKITYTSSNSRKSCQIFCAASSTLRSKLSTQSTAPFLPAYISKLSLNLTTKSVSNLSRSNACLSPVHKLLLFVSKLHTRLATTTKPSSRLCDL